MQKRYTIEEKKHAVQLVKDGLSRAEAARQTGICKDLIRDTMKLIDLHGWQILEQRRIYSAEEKFTILQDMQENQLSLTEASIKYGIKNKKSLTDWKERFQRYGMAGLEKKKAGRSKLWRPADESMSEKEKLEAELQYLRAENEYLKKLQALVASLEKRSRKQRRK